MLHETVKRYELRNYFGGVLSGALAGALGAEGGAVMPPPEPPPAGGGCVTELGGLCVEELAGESEAGFCSPGLQALNTRGNESVARMSETELKEDFFMSVGPQRGVN